jgi:hypothetical protein
LQRLVARQPGLDALQCGQPAVVAVTCGLGGADGGLCGVYHATAERHGEAALLAVAGCLLGLRVLGVLDTHVLCGPNPADIDHHIKQSPVRA